MKDILSEIIGRLQSAEKEYVEAIASGVNIHNFEAYQRMVGKREGVSEALTIIENILSEDEEAE
jgi:aromatic ring-opening dioxygenase catalytic subunit (LigB family)